jgi:type II secretion system protein N
LKRLIFALACLVWFGVVFLTTVLLGFPSEAVTQRLAVEVFEATDGEYRLEIDGVRPWWVGVAATNVKLFQQPKSVRDGAPAPAELMFFAEGTKVRAGLMSLLRSTPKVSGNVTLGDGEIWFDVETAVNRRGTQMGVSEVRLEAEELPVSDLAPLLGMVVEAEGSVDFEVKVEAPEGMRTADGRAKLSGTDIVLRNMELPGMEGMNFDLEIPLEDLEIEVDIKEGAAKITKGRVRSSLASLEIDGDITLREEVARSTMRLQIVVSNLGDEVKMFESMLGDAKWADGKYHYQCSGSLQRPRCSADRERSRSSRSTRTTPSSRLTRDVAVRPEGSTARPSAPTEADADRDKRREEIRERLRKRREEREASSSVRRVPSDEEEEYEREELEDEEEEYEDEEEELENIFGEEADWGDLEELFEED